MTALTIAIPETVVVVVDRHIRSQGEKNQCVTWGTFCGCKGIYLKLRLLKLKFILLATVSLFGMGFFQTAYAQTVDGQVLSIGDGDTFRARVEGETITVRMACIDAAETAQLPWGEDARNHLNELLPINSTVKLRVADVDRYGRTIAEVFTDDQSVNLRMVEQGHAVVYT